MFKVKNYQVNIHQPSSELTSGESSELTSCKKVTFKMFSQNTLNTWQELQADTDHDMNNSLLLKVQSVMFVKPKASQKK